MKKTIQDIKSATAPIVCLTAYTTAMAQAADTYCDLLLVGDSVSMVLYGEDTTQKADMGMMIRHGRAVAKMATNALVIVDMPYGSYEDDAITALTHAQQIMDETGCDGVKLEGGDAISKTIQYLTDNDIPVMAHIGLLPQSVNTPNGYKVQGREKDAAAQLIADAKAVQAAGAFSVVIEAIPEPLAAKISGILTIPTIGIGASNKCDGQILVSEDMLGLTYGHTPKFVKQYAKLNDIIETAIQTYANEVKSRQFPRAEHTYKAKTSAPTNEPCKKSLKKAS